MPRPLVYGNGSLFVGVDERFRIRDLYYPQVGLYNHLSGHSIRMGLWVDGEFTWVDEDGWNREFAYEAGTLVGEARLNHPAYGVEIVCHEAASPGLCIFTRRVSVRSTHPGTRELRLFFTHDLRIAETDIGDTAMFVPHLGGIVHYKGRHWFLFGGEGPQGALFEYATGIKGFAGMEGTWRDAEDGRLSMNPIAQGSVDSTVSLEMNDGGEAEALYWVVCGASLEELEAEFEAKRADGFPSAEAASRQSSADTISTLEEKLQGLPEEIQTLCKTSLLIVRTHCDRGGAILAALDSDIMATNRANYAYCWPRDGAHIAMVLDRLGLYEAPRQFYRFCANLVTKRHPMLLQKYRADGTLGASWHPWIIDGAPDEPFQEDESAAVLAGFAEHIAATGDRQLLEELYPQLVVPMADYMVRYRDEATGVPLPSYDLWEERRGVHTYTAATVFAGLIGAAQMASELGHSKAAEYSAAAQEVREGILSTLYDSGEGRFCRGLTVLPDRSTIKDFTADAATLYLALFGVLDPNDSKFERTMKALRERLWVHGPVGGMARYNADYYFRVSDEHPGNPWIICTLWLAQCQILRAKTLEDLEEPLEALHWAARHSGTTGVLPEQLHPETGEHLSVSPLAWSHSELLKTALDWAEKRRAL